MRITPKKLEYEVAEIRVHLKEKGSQKNPIAVKVDPPIYGEALEALLSAVDLEIEDGKLISFK